MSEDNNFIGVLERIDKKLEDVWHAIDDIKKNMHETELRQSERITKLESQVAINKWLTAVLVAEIIGYAVYVVLIHNMPAH